MMELNVGVPAAAQKPSGGFPRGSKSKESEADGPQRGEEPGLAAGLPGGEGLGPAPLRGVLVVVKQPPKTDNLVWGATPPHASWSCFFKCVFFFTLRTILSS